MPMPHRRSANNTPRSNRSSPRSAIPSNCSTPRSSRNANDKENFKTPTNLNSSRQRWKSASAISDSAGDKKHSHTHTCSPSLSVSDNALNQSAGDMPTSPRGEPSNFVVGVRVRPFTAREESDGSVRNMVSMKGSDLSLECASGTVHTFSYDHCFWSFDREHDSPPYASQSAVFSAMAEPLLDQLMMGYNACLLAYGQTGSGKSYSMMGQDGEEESGMIPRFCSALFERAAQADYEVCVEISFYEIYNEKIHDLLASHSQSGKTPHTPAGLRVREHPTLGPHVVDLAAHSVTSFADVKGWLRVGNSHRITAATGLNETSSRSHSIFTVVVTQQRDGVTCRSKANLVDLAGSERVKNTHTPTPHQLKEGVSINKSLLTLGKVISFLSERGRRRGGVSSSSGSSSMASFGPYRESVLTWLLRESLGGNSKTAMLATISPANLHVDETLATLRYACQARTIVNRVHRNEDPNQRIIRDLRLELEQVAALRAELELLRGGGQYQQQQQQQEIDRLNQKLKEAEEKIAQDQLERSWQEKVRTACERKCAELQYLRGCGVAVESTVDPLLPCLVTLSADPMLSGLVLYPLPPGRLTLGRAHDADIVLHSPLVKEHHCELENSSGELWLRPLEGAETFVNGVNVSCRTQLMHGDRLAVAGVHLFRVRTPAGDTSACADFEQALRELRREQEARLRAELRAEMTTAHAQEVALLDAERRVKTELEMESQHAAQPPLQPYRSSFLQELHSIVTMTRVLETGHLDSPLETAELAVNRCDGSQANPPPQPLPGDVAETLEGMKACAARLTAAAAGNAGVRGELLAALPHLHALLSVLTPGTPNKSVRFAAST